MILAHELNELRLLDLVCEGREPTEAEVAKAVADLGTWLCPHADEPVRQDAARAYLGQRGAQSTPRPAREDTWSVAGVLHVDDPAAIAVEVHELPVAGGSRCVHTGTLDERGAFAFEIAGARSSVVELRTVTDGGTVAKIGPVRTQPQTWVTWCQPGIAPRRPGRYEVQRRWLDQLGGGAAVRDEVLAVHSGLAPHELRRHRGAEALAPHLGGNPALAWALITACPGTDELSEPAWLDDARAALAARPPSELRAMLDRALADRLVGSAHGGDVPRVVEAHAALRREVWLAQRPHPAASTWRELLGAAGLAPEQLAALPRVFDASLDDVHRRLLEPATPLAPAVRAHLEWAPLARFDHAALGRAGDAAPRDAVARRPPGALAAQITDDAAHRAEIVAGLEAAFPGHAVLWELRDELGDGADPLFEAGLLDLDRLTVGLWDGAHDSDGISAVRDRRAPIPPVSPDVRDALMKHQRLLRVGQTKAATLALARAGFDSAHAIAAASPAAFAAAVAPHGIPTEAAAQLRARAAARQRAATSMFLDSVAARRSAPIAPAAPANTAAAAESVSAAVSALTTEPPASPAARAIAAPAASGPVARLAPVTSRIPTLSTLFGPLDDCACEDCESVVSQSAYLVDLLLWLDRVPLVQGSAYAAFVARRPDVPQIELACAGSETAVPHIDLACEQLEDRAATALGLAPIAARQTIGTAAEIRACPEHLDTAVYTRLADPAVSSWPYAEAVAELRGYLAQLKTSRAAVIATFGDVDGTEGIAEALGLGAAQLTVVGTANPAAQPAIWGAAPGAITMNNLLRRGAALLGANRSYAALVQLLRAPLLAQGRTLHIDLVPDASGAKVDLCRADQRTISYATGSAAPVPIDAATLDRLHRVVRLAGALGWDPWHTCAVLSGLGGALDAPGLARLAVARGAAARLALTALELALLFGDFDGVTGSPLDAIYRSLFYVDGKPLQGALGTLASALGAALGISAAAAGSLVAALGLASTPAGPASLAAVYRHARLAGALGLSIASYLARRALTASPPLSSADPALIRAFIDLDALLDGAGVDDARLARWLAAAPEPPASVTALWTGLATARQRRPDAVPATFIADGLWREAITGWLVLPASDAAPAQATIATRFADALAAVVAWAFSAPADAAAPPPATAALLGALATLRRFGDLFELPATRPALAPDPVNPALTAFVTTGTWAALADYLRFATAGAGSLAAARPLFTTPPTPAAAPGLAAAAGISADDAAAVLAGFPASVTGAAARWQLVSRRLDLARATGIPAAVLARAAAAPDAAAAQALRDAYRSSVPRAVWLATSTVVQNALRPQRRDALLAFLLAATGKTAQELSADALNDVLTGEGRDRTRIGEACAAIQTFVNRIFLGLEPALVRVEDPLWAQWTWRKRYAVWAGNRTVFLFPENYLSTGRRPLTSPLFADFQQAILRGEINEANVSAALVNYLDGLAQISDLEYLAVGSDYDSNDDSEFTESRLFTVVGRTRGAPGRYYFSTLEHGAWSPFEELKLGEDPSHIAVFSAPSDTTSPLDRHIIVWPKTTLLPRPDEISNPQTPAANKVTPTNTVLAVKYAWTERHGESDWSQPRTTSSSLLYNGSVLTERQMLLAISTVGRVLPGEFQIATHFYKPPPAAPTPAQKLAPSLVGAMNLRRDTTDKLAYDNTYVSVNVSQSGPDPATWSGPSPADELVQQYLSTRPAALGTPVPPGKSPWPGLRYDQNRMRPAVGAATARAPALVAPFLPDAPLITPITPYSATVLPWRNFAGIPYPSAWALFASGASWSFFFVQKDTFPPDATKQGKQALGLGPELFGTAQPYAGVPAYHAYADKLLALVKDGGLAPLYGRVVQRRPAEALRVTARRYAEELGLNPASVFVPSSTRGAASTIEGIDFSGLAPHANYNLELFVFAPLLVAATLHARGAYDASQRFFHHVFNPLEGQVPAGNGNPWWITPAFDIGAGFSLAQLMIGAVGATNPYVDIEADPFDAHAIAFQRRSAYQRYIVMEYLRNILDWGDSLYAKLDLEDLDEAGQLYNLAASILGDRPLAIPPVGTRAPRTFHQPSDWAPSGNVLVAIENLVGDVAPTTATGGADPVVLPLVPAAVTGGPQRLYFSIPRNAALVKFYDRIDQSLANLRTVKSLGLNTVVDVQALVNAAAAGRASLYDALAPSGKPALGPRFRVLVAKALELCNDARSLAAEVQSASEHHDAEHLAVLRSTWDGKLTRAARDALAARLLEAQRELDALAASRAVAAARSDYYGGRERMSDGETTAFMLTTAGTVLSAVASAIEITAPAATVFPDVTIGVSGAFASPVATVKVGGSNIGGGVQAAARGIASIGGLIDRAASMVATQAGYDRRMDDWQFQKDQADLEVKQLDAQKAAATARVQIAQAELDANVRQQAARDDEEAFLLTKYTTQELYLWLLDQTNQLSARAYELATDLARRAATAFAFELPDAPIPTLAQTWDAAKRGALAADQLAFSLRQMEADHLALDRPDVVVTRRLALSQLDSVQLAALRRPAAGSPAGCSIPVPAWWLDRLDPGLHRRRIRSVSVSLPCLGGPNAAVNATLACAGATPSPITSIRLDTGINDRGGDLGADRYAPFEGIALDGDTRWTLAFPPHTEIDPATIADVVLAIEYTAYLGSDGGASSPTTPWRIRLDLERDAPLAWQALTRSSSHVATLAPLDHVPAVLRELTKVAGTAIAALDAAGNPVGGVTATPGATVHLDGTAVTASWSAVAAVFVDLDLVEAT